MYRERYRNSLPMFCFSQPVWASKNFLTSGAAGGLLMRNQRAFPA
jgi:hypothetical protein